MLLLGMFTWSLTFPSLIAQEISISGTSKVPSETLYAALNESVTMEWKIEEQESRIKTAWSWTKPGGVAPIILAEMDKQGVVTVPFIEQFKGRLKMHTNGSLTISGLLYNDSGRYDQFATFSDKGEQKNLLDLIIIDKITKMKISVNSSITLNDRCNLTLNCTAEDGSNVSYSWKVSGNNISFYSGTNLHVSLPVTNERTLITCNASNPISSKIYLFSTREVCGIPNNAPSNIQDMIRLVGLICLFAFTKIIF